MRKKLIVFCILALLIAGCGSKSAMQETAPKVGTWKTAQTMQPYIYDKFMFNGEKAEIFSFTNPGDQKAALLAGSLDFTGTTIALAIIAASKHEPIVVVSGLCNKCSALVVRSDSDIKQLADLKGKTIGYVPGTMHHVLLLEVLNRQGLSPEKDVILKRVDFFDMGQALAQHNIDAFMSGEPYPAKAVKDGYGKVLSYPYFDQSIGTINAVMITTRDKIKNTPQLIQKLVTLHAKSTEYLKLHTTEWLDVAATFGTNRQVLDIAKNNIELAWELDQNYIQRTRNLAQRMKDLGMITEIPDIDSLFDLTFIQQAQKDVKNNAL